MEFIKLSVDGEVEKLSYVDKSKDEEEYYHAFNAFIHEAIDCDYYEIAPAYNLMHDDIAVLVDEEGKLIGKRINHVAWILCNGANIFDEIVGDVLFCGLCRTG